MTRGVRRLVAWTAVAIELALLALFVWSGAASGVVRASHAFWDDLLTGGQLTGRTQGRPKPAPTSQDGSTISDGVPSVDPATAPVP